MSVATALARSRPRLRRTISRAQPRMTVAKTQAEPTAPTPITPIFISPSFVGPLSRRRFGGLAANNPDRNRLGRRCAALSIPAVERDQSVGFWVIGRAGTAWHTVRHHVASAGDRLRVVARGALGLRPLIVPGVR